MDIIITIVSALSGLSSLTMMIYSIILRQKVKTLKKREENVRHLVKIINDDKKFFTVLVGHSPKSFPESAHYKKFLKRVIISDKTVTAKEGEKNETDKDLIVKAQNNKL